MNRWNSLVQEIKKNYHQKENEIQKLWEDIFADSYYFGYSKRMGEIDSQRNITIGSRDRTIPDIIIRDVANNKDLFVVELKQLKLSFDIRYKEKLFSYLRLLRVDVGVLVCDKIYIYILENGNEKIEISIPFEENNPNGKSFIELFSKGIFSNSKTINFIEKEIKAEKNINDIRQELRNISLENLICQYFSSKYSDDEIEKALNNFSISIHEIAKNTLTNVSEPPMFSEPITPTNPHNDYYDEPDDIDYIIIKTSQKWVDIRGSLYEATRSAWHINIEKANRYPYVFSVIDGVVKDVYFVQSWHLVTTGVGAGRGEFVGYEASPEIRNRFINKKIPPYYSKRGMASPTLYKQKQF